MMSAQLQESGPVAQGSTPPSTKPTNNATTTTTTTTTATRTMSPMKNMLGDGNSPYLESQKESSVQWQLFNDAAITRAKTENKLIFLHIGFTAAYHCYMMQQESFTNSNVAATLNKHFIPVIVDREERPDLDNIYMEYMSSLIGVAGHPLNVFLTPELEPVFAGAYFPAPGSRQINSETGEEVADFLFVLKRLKALWEESEDRIREDGNNTTKELRKVLGEGSVIDLEEAFAPIAASTEAHTSYSVPAGDVDLDHIEKAYSHMSRTFDLQYGGFIHIPPNVPTTFLSGQVDLAQLQETYEFIKASARFLTTAKLSFLLRSTQFPEPVRSVVGEDLGKFVSGFALRTLLLISDGAIYDQIGGGLYRFSTTRDWSQPSFEKMVSDNAAALGLYVDAWLQAAGSPSEDRLYRIVTALADYLTAPPILTEAGGFVTSEASYSCVRKGDNVLHSGAYYLWRKKEFDAVIGDEQESAVAAAYWGVQEDGNVEKDQDPNDEYLNQNVLRVVADPQDISEQLKVPKEIVVQSIDSARTKLRAHRERERPRPAVDTKIVTAYNGMVISALARAAAALASRTESDRAAQYLNSALNAASFIKKQLWDSESKTLYRMYNDKRRSTTEAFAEDFAFLIEGLLDLYEATAAESWLEWADELQDVQIQKFNDGWGSSSAGRQPKSRGFFCTTQDTANVLIRHKNAMDTTQPSTNSVSASNLFRLGLLLGDDRYTLIAKQTVNAFDAEMGEHPYLFPGLLCSLVSWKLGGQAWVAVEPSSVDLAPFQTTPRGGLRTLLHFKPGSAFFKSRSPKLFETLARLNLSAGVYILQGDRAVAPTAVDAAQ